MKKIIKHGSLVAFLILTTQKLFAESFEAQVQKKVEALQISSKDFQSIVAYVSNNEFGSDPEGIVSWNVGEDFASLGIGHFIWYPEGVPQKFEESFPKMARFLLSRWNFEGLSPREEALFHWAKNLFYRPDQSVRFCPWSTREAFLRWKKEEPKEFRDLVDFLSHPTIQFLQSQYLDFDFRVSLIEVSDTINAQEDLVAMEASVGENISQVKRKIEKNILNLLETKWGYTALLDYINFKGDGIDQKMRYKGVGWGLQQALYYVEVSNSDISNLKSFSLATLNRLERRSRLATNPIERNQWIHGWANRVLGYGFYDSDSEMRALAALRNDDGTLKWPKLSIGERALRRLF